MASEYLKWKYRDVKPDEPVVLTPRQKRRNWWDYHKWHVIIGIVLLVSLIDIGGHALHIGEVRPDYQFAYVGSAPLPDDTVSALEAAFGELGGDANGDGRVAVRVNQYVVNGSEAEYTAISNVKLMADLEDCESAFFILEDAETFQIDYEILLPTDGGKYAVKWSDCPTLDGLELGGYATRILGETAEGDSGELMKDLYIARRGFWTDKTCDNQESCDKLWEIITEGAY